MSEITSLVNQCNLTHRQVETWFRNRRNQDRPSNSKKFCEASWRFVFYLLAFTAGFASLINTPWFWDQRECWRGFPQQPVQDVHYWYYMLELGFYWSLLLCVSVDVKRKSAKMFNYAGWKKTCDSLFVIFAAVFLVTRLLLFPSKIIYTSLVLSMEMFEPFVGYYFFNALLLVLQALHIYWAYLILRMIYKFLFLGK
ncbi:hypothetical protein cypCar_00048643, partial [Cyprinus carpio]